MSKKELGEQFYIKEGLLERGLRLSENHGGEPWQEMRDCVLPGVLLISERLGLPLLKNKGIKVIDSGEDLGGVVTNLDVTISSAILEGNTALGVRGLRELYPGSFSEEQDSSDRREATVVYQVDPCDGTGDAVKTIGDQTPISPTLLISRLERDTIADQFKPTSGLVYDIMNKYGFFGDKDRLSLFKINKKGTGIVEVKFRVINEPWRKGDVVSLAWRRCYPQDNAHMEFPNFLANQKSKIKQVSAGGAGSQALQLLRRFIELENPKDLPEFYYLEPIDVLFNTQPDWKTWDVDPSVALMRNLGAGEPTDIYGGLLEANAACLQLANMHHKKGILLANNRTLASVLAKGASEFEKKTGLSLTEKNY